MVMGVLGGGSLWLSAPMPSVKVGRKVMGHL